MFKGGIWSWLCLVFSFVLLWEPVQAQSRANSQMQTPIRSAALSLHFELPELGLSYLDSLKYIKKLGASHVTINVQAVMDTIYSSKLSFSHPEASSFRTLKEVIRQAQTLGLKVIIFPIIWIKERPNGEWRGQLNPKERSDWWSSYEKWLMDLAMIAQDYRLDYLSIGSELSSLETDSDRWLSLISRIRSVYQGKLTYSANWDHFADVPFWSHLDVIGLTAYYPLIEAGQQASSLKLYERWRLINGALVDWLSNYYPEQKIFFTELGYPSQSGGLSRPWYYLQGKEIDLKGQAMAFEAFRKAWHNSPSLLGVNIWNLWGLGGPHDSWYTVRGKPAAIEVIKLFKQLSSRLKQDTTTKLKVNK